MSWNLYCFSLLGILVSLTAVCLFGIEALGGRSGMPTLTWDRSLSGSVSGVVVSPERGGSPGAGRLLSSSDRVERLAGDAK
jgi:hypothetical protein